MKKGKSKADQKSKKKESKKVRKELQSELSARFKDVIKSLGHEAEVISKDIEKAGKLLSKKLSGMKVKPSASSASLFKTLDAAIEEVKAQNPAPEIPEPAPGTAPATRRRRTSTAQTKPDEVAPAVKRRGRRPANKAADAVPAAKGRRGRTPQQSGETAPEATAQVKSAPRGRRKAGGNPDQSNVSAGENDNKEQ